MKTAIIYSTTHGFTTSVVQQLKEKLNGEVDIINLRQGHPSGLDSYHRIILGGSIHAGQIQRRLRDFIEQNLDVLANKELGLFICCMHEGQEAKDQLLNAFPEKLHQYSKAEAILGGAFDFDKMNFLERMIVRKVAGVRESTRKTDHKAVERFARRMDKTFAPMFLLI